MEENKSNSAMGVGALTLGIISILTVCFYYMSIPTGILGIVLGAKSARKTGSKVGKAGAITGIVGLSLCVFIYVSLILLMIASY